MEDIINAEYAHAKRVCKDFEIKNCMFRPMQYCQDTYVRNLE